MDRCVVVKVVFMLCLLCIALTSASTRCPCDRPQHCNPIQHSPNKEVFIFSREYSTPDDWRSYDWTKVTTVAMAGFVSPELACLAHSHGARAVALVNIQKHELTQAAARQRWIRGQLKLVRDNFLDGINIDFEEVVSKAETAHRDGYSALVADTYRQFKEANSNYQVTVDVPWSPDCIDGRCYDVKALAASTDFIFIMGYDHRSQVFGECVAGANAGYPKSERGIRKYLDLGISPDRLVLGVPWYGYKYPCLSLSEDNKCQLPAAEFRGVDCSNNAGFSYTLAQLVAQLQLSSSGRQWDPLTRSPFFNHLDPSTGQWHQAWYDDAESLGHKYRLAERLGLRGVGMWNADCLLSGDSPEAIQLREAMWGALPSYK